MMRREIGAADEGMFRRAFEITVGMTMEEWVVRGGLRGEGGEGEGMGGGGGGKGEGGKKGKKGRG